MTQKLDLEGSRKGAGKHPHLPLPRMQFRHLALDQSSQVYLYSSAPLLGENKAFLHLPRDWRLDSSLL